MLEKGSGGFVVETLEAPQLWDRPQAGHQQEGLSSTCG